MWPIYLNKKRQKRAWGDMALRGCQASSQPAMILVPPLECLTAGASARQKGAGRPEENSVDNFVDKAKLTFRKMWIEYFDRRQEGHTRKNKRLKSMS
ncbi:MULTISPECIES: hypothetical protein [unclassified Janthinobacterium]|uniref:hypothetical protein n=1 Tax=unclassified Janthinobacterium TaxID=2610881 RepID=UPI00111343BC|nr:MULTISPECIES: hypothetical protein [unclassified Janthinobacterium]